jgi:hypothetical protein
MAQGKPDLPVHHFTGLRAVGIVNGRPVWPIKGGSEDDKPDDKPDDHPDVSLEDLQSHLAELGLTPGQLKGRLAASRRWEDRAKEKDPEFQTAKEKAAQYDALLATTQTDQERAVEQAKQEARAAAQLEAAPRIVRAEFRAAAKGVLSDEQLAGLMEFVSEADPTKYLTESGDVDEDKIAKRVASFAPKDQQKHVDLGQGKRRTDVKPSVASGRELYEASRKRTA